MGRRNSTHLVLVAFDLSAKCLVSLKRAVKELNRDNTVLGPNLVAGVSSGGEGCLLRLCALFAKSQGERGMARGICCNQPRKSCIAELSARGTTSTAQRIMLFEG